MATDKDITQPKGEVELLISQAIANKVDIATLTQLFELRKQYKAEKAEEAYYEAISKFQQECPKIEKRTPVYEKNSTTKVRYYYAPLGDIADQIKKPLGDNGLSYSFSTIQKDTQIGVSCKVTHRLGYSYITDPFFIPIGEEAFMSQVQKFGARLTFAERYSLCMALGITTADNDTDAKNTDVVDTKGIDPKDVELINSISDKSELLKTFSGLKPKYPKIMKTLVNLYTARKEEIEAEEKEKQNAQ